MKVEGKSTRFHERTKLETPIEVIYRENGELEWREQTRTDEVTILGCGFTLSRPVEPNRLIHLKMALPPRFRLYDFGKTHYEVWALVRYLRLLSSKNSGQISLKVGAALTGTIPPKSFLLDPTTKYDLKPVLRKNSLWELRELPRRTGRYVRSDEERRPIETTVILEAIGDDGRITESVPAVTQNISESGAALTARLLSDTPRYLIVNTINGTLSLLARVRGIHPLDENNNFRLNLEFLSGKWFV